MHREDRGNVKHTRSSTIADLNLQFEQVKRKYFDEPAPVSDASKNSPIEIALSHHSTPVMIYITVHCPFPALTFQQQMAFNFKTGDVNQHGVKVAMKKYVIDRDFSWEGFPCCTVGNKRGSENDSSQINFED